MKCEFIFPSCLLNDVWVYVHVYISLIPRPKEEEKGPGFSCLRMRLIAVEFHILHIFLYIRDA